MKVADSISTSGTTDDIFLTGSIFLASMDSDGMVDYTIRSVIGGLVWLGIRIFINYYNRKQRVKKGNNKTGEQQQEEGKERE